METTKIDLEKFTDEHRWQLYCLANRIGHVCAKGQTKTITEIIDSARELISEIDYIAATKVNP